MSEDRFSYPKDPRGTLEERLDANSAIRAYEVALQERFPHRFHAMRAVLFWPLREAFKTLPFCSWPAKHREAWELAVAGSITIAGASRISGKSGNMMIIDDTKKETTPVKPIKQPKKTYNTVGVRFVRGTQIANVYTYRVPKKVKLHLGEEIVVPSLYDGYRSNSIAVVVDIHSTPQDTGPHDYKFVTGRITRVKA